MLTTCNITLVQGGLYRVTHGQQVYYATSMTEAALWCLSQSLTATVH